MNTCTFYKLIPGNVGFYCLGNTLSVHNETWLFYFVTLQVVMSFETMSMLLGYNESRGKK